MQGTLPRDLTVFWTVSWHQAWVASAGDRSQIRSFPASGDLPPGESLTFTANGACRVNITPPAHPVHTIYVDVMAFIINNHDDLRLCLPPVHQIASASSS